MTKKLSLLVLLILILSGLPHVAPLRADETAVRFRSYRDIPGVTKDEIAAIEKLKAQRLCFFYGMPPSTEAFYDENRKKSGFAALFCEWLTQIFDIPFQLEISEWGPFINGLKSHNIDFTGDLTITEERIKAHFMTGTIADRFVKVYHVAGGASRDDPKPVYAFLSGAITRDLIADHSPFPFDSVYADNYDEVYRLLKSGAADAFFVDAVADSSFDAYADVSAEYFYPPHQPTRRHDDHEQRSGGLHRRCAKKPRCRGGGLY
jgi:ABC-type amino acid transport substrate-binding protein